VIDYGRIGRFLRYVGISIGWFVGACYLGFSIGVPPSALPFFVGLCGLLTLGLFVAWDAAR
jgi:hypothetical protein